ncbi:MAG: helix-turn-helix domain-containing protein [Nanoarchaeota archaeon]|nr:helix-turn-helix domain-containing protein [Nanoarchaeota archaeon]
MWHLKFKAKHNDCIYAPKIMELAINTFFYPLGSYKKGRYIFSSLIQIVNGDEKKIRAYEKYLKKHKLIAQVERVGNIIFSLSKHGIKQVEYTALYNPELFYPVPGNYNEEGFEIWSIASWNRAALENVIKLIKNAKATTYFEILKLKKEIIKEIYLPKLFPKLSEKQQEAFNLAVKNGYYKIPKGITLEKLAKIMKISKPTLQEHLRKAESKLIPLFNKKP